MEFKTFRRRGHEEASGTKYVPKSLMESWEAKDPIVNFENYLIAEKTLNSEKIDLMRSEISDEIQNGLKKAFEEPPIQADIDTELNDVYKPFDFQITTANNEKSKKRFIDAVSDGLFQAMEKHQDLSLIHI